MQSVICTHYDADTLAAVTDTSKLFQLQTFKTFISEMYTCIMYVCKLEAAFSICHCITGRATGPIFVQVSAADK